MNETIVNILTRRSVRDFSDRPVSREQLDQLVKAALSAPSAHGKPTVHLAVIADRKIRDRITQKMPWFKPASQPPVAILVMGDPNAGVQKGYWPQDCAALTENILIAARSLELGTTWCGIHPIPENEAHIRELIEIPEGLVPFGMIGIGYPARPDAFQERNREDDARRVHWYPDWGIAERG